MRKFAIGLLALFRRAALALRRMRGTAEDDLAARRVVSGQAWDEFCDTLKAAGASLNFPGAPRDAFNQAEGYRYLTRLTRAGLMAFVEHADPRAPVLHRVAHETVKLGADNPDNYYQTAAISGAYEYRITGRRNTVTYLGFGTQAGHYGQGGGLPPTGYIEAGELETDTDGPLRADAVHGAQGGELATDDPGNRHAHRAPDLPGPRDRSSGRTAHRTHRSARRGGASGPADAGSDRRRAEVRQQAGRRRVAALREMGARLPEARQRPAAVRPGHIEHGGRRSEHRLLPQPLGARPGRGPRHRSDATAVRVLELPAQQLLDGVPRLPPSPHSHQQAPGPLRTGRLRPPGRGPRGPRAAELDRDRRA